MRAVAREVVARVPCAAKRLLVCVHGAALEGMNEEEWMALLASLPVPIHIGANTR